MKKLLVVCLFIIVAVSAFAAYDITLKAGGSFALLTGKTSVGAKNSDALSKAKFNSAAFGGDLGFELDLNKNVQFYLDITLGFPKEVEVAKKITRDDVAAAMEADKKANPTLKFHSGNTFMRSFSAHFGFAHKLDLGLGEWEFTVGAGFGIRRISAGFMMIMTETEKPNKPFYFADYHTVTTLSTGLHGTVRYNLSARLSMVLTVKPDVGFFTIARHIDYDKKDSDGYATLTDTELTESTGFSFSFGMTAVLGLTYTF